MTDVILGVILLVIIGAAVIYIVKAKKRGVKCIGCSAGSSCGKHQEASSGCGCGCHGETKE